MKTPKNTTIYSCQEPPTEGRRNLCELSDAEMAALVQWHRAQRRRIQRIAGAMVTGSCAASLAITPAQQVALLEEAQSQIVNHRARGIELRRRMWK